MNTFTKRAISGIVYAGLLISSILWCKYSFLVFMLFAISVMMHEFMRMTMGSEYKVSQTLTIIAGCVLFGIVWAIRAFDAIIAKFCFVAMIPVFVVMVNSLYVKYKKDFGKFANVYTALMYIAIPFTIYNFLVFSHDGQYSGWLLLAFFLIIWASDTGAYLFGMSLGQKFGKKLFPSISPKKSWVGFWGGLFLALVVGVVLFLTGSFEFSGLKDFSWYHALGLSAVMNVSGVYGDLFESQWKRHYEVKDSGSIIPGHGGLLDRFDSAIFAIPAGMIYLAVFNFI